MNNGSREQSSWLNDSTIDRLALSRAKHLQTRDERTKSFTDDELDVTSDWSDSDRECCPLSDVELALNIDESIDENYFNKSSIYKNPFLHEMQNFDSTTTITTTAAAAAAATTTKKATIRQDSNGRITATRISFNDELEKPTRQQYVKKNQQQKNGHAPLLPGRRVQTRSNMARRSSIRSTTTTSQSSFSSHLTKSIGKPPSYSNHRRDVRDGRLSPNSSVHSNEKSLLDDHQHRRNISPNFSQTSTFGTRVHESRRTFIDDNDYGRLTDANSRKSSPARERQKWGTIVHPPFPLGYQQVTAEQLAQVVERLSSPVRCRDRHAAVQSPSKRYLSIEETTSLINRLSKVKQVQSPDQYWPSQRPSRSVKNLHSSNSTNWKTVSAPA